MYIFAKLYYKKKKKKKKKWKGTPLQSLARFVRYLKIINTFIKNDIRHAKQFV